MNNQRNQTQLQLVELRTPQQPELFKKAVGKRKAKEQARREQVQALIDFYKDRKPRAGGES